MEAIKRVADLKACSSIASTDMRFILELSWDFLCRFWDVAKLLTLAAGKECIPSVFKQQEQDGMFHLFLSRIPCGQKYFEALCQTKHELFAEANLFKTGEYFLRIIESQL